MVLADSDEIRSMDFFLRSSLLKASYVGLNMPCIKGE
jgi:hypothetical protein